MGHTYSRSDLEDIQITHYLTCGAELLHSGTRQNPPMKPADFAEIVIYYGGRRTGAGVDIDDDVVKTTLLGMYSKSSNKQLLTWNQFSEVRH